jgi:hypothetical protein
MHAALTQGAATDPDKFARYRASFRTVFDRFAVHPTKARHPYAVTPYARLSVIMGIELFPKMRSAEEMLAEQGRTMPFSANGTVPI